MKTIRQLTFRALSLLAILLLQGCLPETRPGAPTNDTSGNDVNGFVYSIAVQPDGKFLIGGQYGSIGAQSRNGIARFLHTTGDMESTATFNVGAGLGGAILNKQVEAIAVVPDGIIVGGLFTEIAGVACSNIAKLNGNGSVDTAFTDAASAANVGDFPYCLAVQPNGKILVGGLDRLMRLNSDGTHDASFAPSFDGGYDVLCVAIQANGNILVGGSLTTTGVEVRNGLVRLDGATGAVDATFDAALDGGGIRAHCLVLANNGDVLVGDDFLTVGGLRRNGFAQLSPNGTPRSMGAEFSGAPGWTTALIKSITLQSDGKILVGGEFSATSDHVNFRHHLVRLAANRHLDSTFDAKPVDLVHSLALAENGLVILGGGLNDQTKDFYRLYNDPATATLAPIGGNEARLTCGGSTPVYSRVEFDLSTDLSTWTPLGAATPMAGSVNNWQLTGLSLPTSGWLRARGRTSSGRGNGSAGIVQKISRFPADSTVPETTIASGPVNTVSSDSATFVFSSSEPALHYTYTIDGGPPVEIAGNVVTFPGLTQGVHSVYVFATDLAGNADPTPARRQWTVNINLPFPGSGDATFLHNAVAPPSISGGNVFRLAVQPDGKILAAGSFSTVEGEPRRYFARFLPGGALESTADFNIGDGALSFIEAMCVQADGKILIAGSFTDFNGSARNRIARLHENGAVEDMATFNIGTGASSNINSMAVQPDGKIVITGDFTSFNGQPRERIARLNSDGTLDPGYQPVVNGTVLCMTIQPDGKIVIGGAFIDVDGQSRNAIARLNTDGTLDATFTSPFGSFAYPIALAVQPDGKILVAGWIVGLVRLLPNGTLESAPDFLDGSNFQQINDLTLQSDGKILIVGDFTSVAGQARGGIARLYSNGVPESTNTFTTGTGALNDADPGTVNAVALQADGKILVGGQFTSIGGTPFTHLARLNNDASISTLFIHGVSPSFGFTTIHWTLSNAAPEFSQVVFQFDGGAGWVDLGPGERTDAGWGISGLDLSYSGSIRALGRTIGRPGNPGLVAVNRVLGPPVQIWQQDNFGIDVSNPLIGGNFADPDGDGTVNLMEYAGGTDPLSNASAPRLTWGFEGAAVTFTYDRSIAATDATITVQKSEDLVIWTTATEFTEQVLSNNGVTEKVKITMPFDITNPPAPKGFIRAKVSVGP